MNNNQVLISKIIKNKVNFDSVKTNQLDTQVYFHDTFVIMILLKKKVI
jgi:hypothetical protein